MRKLLITAIALITFTGFTAGIAYENGSAPECEDGEVCIMNKAMPAQPTKHSNNGTDGSTATATTGIGPNGTEYRVTLTTTSKSCSKGNATDSVTQQDWLTKESYPPQHEFKFNGTMITANPCVTLDHEITKENGIYTLNILTVPGDGACVQCVGMVKYNATVEVTAEYFQMEVQHNGENVGSFAPPQDANTGGFNPNKPEPRTGFLSGIMSWFRSFF